MSRKPRILEFNTFDKGLITEVNPMSFPEGAAIDEMNFEIRPDGTRERRKGLINEVGHTVVVGDSTNTDLAASSFLWENVSGYSNASVVVVQYGGTLFFYRTTEETLVGGSLGSRRLYTDASSAGGVRTDGLTPVDYAVVDGRLIVTTGYGGIATFEANMSDVGDVISVHAPNYSRLTIRDTFGVPVEYDYSVKGERISLDDPLYVHIRPTAEGLEGGDNSGVFTTNRTSELFPGSVWTLATRSAGDTISTLFGLTVDSFYSYIVSTTRGYTINFLNSGGPSVSSFQLRHSGTGELLTFTKNSGNTWFAGSSEASPLYDAANIPAGFHLTVVGEGNLPPSPHVYNLRNQSFAPRRIPKTGTVTTDPIAAFVAKASAYPSNADSVNAALYPNTEEDNKTVDRFHEEDLLSNPPGKFRSPVGAFIIDALNRSTSREERWLDTTKEFGYGPNEVVGLSPDITEGGAKAVAEYGGRAWYGGFSEKNSGTSDTRLESYLLYSQLSNSVEATYRCYQAGDPTSLDEPDVLATDGGVISLDGAWDIKKLVVLGNYLVVFAENGVWAVSGSDGNLFTPLSQRVNKVSDKGCVSPRSVVVVDTSVFFWSLDGIYTLALSEEGGFSVNSLTSTTIQRVYDKVEDVEKRSASGKYSPFEERITWIVNNSLVATEDSTLLQLSLLNGAWTRHVVEAGGQERCIVEQVKTPRFVTRPQNEDIVDGDKAVVNDEEPVVVVQNKVESVARTSKWASVIRDRGQVHMSFSSFEGQDFKDWGEIDAKAYLVTGYINENDNHNVKRAPYANFHFLRTEDGFKEDENGDLTPLHESGCKIQPQWEWANSEASGRWGRAFQGYRYKRLYMPDDVHDTFDTGFRTIVTRNKLRGKGRVLSLKLETEPEKDCKLLGWTMEMA